MADWHGLLECPQCGAGLAEAGGALACAAGHSFDIARQGYVNLLPGGASAGTADTPEMVAARSAFLARGHFRPIDEALAEAVASAVDGHEGCAIDVGAGTGEHLAAVLERLPHLVGLALDISKHAARRASRAHPRLGAVVCDAWGRLPVRDGVAAVVMCVFAPRNASEFARVLAPGGALAVVTPTARHLHELIEPMGMISVDPEKSERVGRALGEHFAEEKVVSVEYPIELSVADAIALVSMGPSARHTSPEQLSSRAEALGPLIAATVSVEVTVWRLTAPAQRSRCRSRVDESLTACPDTAVFCDLAHGRAARYDLW